MAIGYLLIQVRTAQDAVPLEGVHVRVLGDQGELLYHLMTDESGETQKVPLETLDKGFSQNPYYTGLPYKSYNVLAQGEGFDTLYVSHIPIYEGETAVLPMELVPMEARQRRPEETKIFIGKPAVAMQEPRTQEGNVGAEAGSNITPRDSGVPQPGTRPEAGIGAGGTMQGAGTGPGEGISQEPGNGMGAGTRPGAGNGMENGSTSEAGTDGGRILRQVVIPNPITVHLGTPSSNASNVQVSFPDYVKNVASSEIYPTWPDASLRANIYAIITFALNRIFTEWYRSRGYDYDITSSTAYDQNFVYGRPIYDSISRVVDDIFNEYVRRPGQIAPYFNMPGNVPVGNGHSGEQWIYTATDSAQLLSERCGDRGGGCLCQCAVFLSGDGAESREHGPGCGDRSDLPEQNPQELSGYPGDH